MGTIYFTRHGQASFGESNYDQLCENGLIQARLLGNYLVSLGLSFDAAYRGEMVRQKQSGDEVISVYKENGISFPEVEEVSDLNEFRFGSLIEVLLPVVLNEDPLLSNDVSNMTKDRKAFKRIIDIIIERWLSGNKDLGDLAWEVFTNRIKKGITTVLKENSNSKNIIIFSSGGPISTVAQMALNLSDDMTARLAWEIFNASITRFAYKQEEIRLISFNDVSFLELEGKKELITYR